MAEKSDKSPSSVSKSVLERLSAVEATLERIVSILEGRASGVTSTGTSEQTSNVTQGDWDSLGAKLDQLEQTLSGKEKAVLLLVMGAAAATYERAGLRESPALPGGPSTIKLTGALDKVRLSDGLRSIGSFTDQRVGGFGGGANPLADSVGVGGDFTCVHGDWSKDLAKIGALDDAMVRGRWAALDSAAVVGGLGTGGFGRSGAGGGFG